MNFNEWVEYKIARKEIVTRNNEILILVLSIVFSICGVFFAYKAIGISSLILPIPLITIAITGVFVSRFFNFETIVAPFSHVACAAGMRMFVEALSSSFYHLSGDKLAFLILATVLSIIMSAVLMYLIILAVENDYNGIYCSYYIIVYALFIYIIPIIESAYRVNNISLILFIIMLIVAFFASLFNLKSKK